MQPTELVPLPTMMQAINIALCANEYCKTQIKTVEFEGSATYIFCRWVEHGVDLGGRWIGWLATPILKQT